MRCRGTGGVRGGETVTNILYEKSPFSIKGNRRCTFNQEKDGEEKKWEGEEEERGGHSRDGA